VGSVRWDVGVEFEDDGWVDGMGKKRRIPGGLLAEA